MSQGIFFYLKPTLKTPNQFKKKFLSKDSRHPQIFKAVPTSTPYYVVFNRDNQTTTWTIRDNFNYLQLYWSMGNIVNRKEDMKLKSGEQIIILRVVMRGLFISIIRMIIFLTKIRNKICYEYQEISKIKKHI